MKKNETTRKFGVSFNEVITKSQSIQPQYLADVDLFSAFDSTFTSSFGDELGRQTSEAFNDFSGSSHMAAINRKTEEISVLLESSGKEYQKLLYFVHDAFGTSKAVENTFGRPQYPKARKSEKYMVPLLRQAVKAASLDEFKPGLDARGLPSRLIATLEELAGQLAAADSEQEMLKKQQLIVTNARVGLYNSIWEKLVKISNAAKIIFVDDEARLTIYQLYDSKPSVPATPETEEEPGI